MITYDPPQLEGRLQKALVAFRRSGFGELIECFDIVDPSDPDFEPGDHVGVVVRADDSVEITLPRCEHYVASYESLVDSMAEIAGADMLDDTTCVTPSRLLRRVNLAHNMTDDAFQWWISVTDRAEPVQPASLCVLSGTSPIEYRCSLAFGATPFAFLVAKSGEYSKYLPPIMHEDCFVQVEMVDVKGNVALAESIVDAHLHELASSAGVVLEPERRPLEVSPDFDSEGGRSEPRLRPLDLSRGMRDLHGMYNHAARASDSDVRILLFAKVLEYVAQTVMRQRIGELARVKLASRDALQPTQEFIMDLQAFFMQEGKVAHNDKQVMRLAILRCCDLSGLASVMPEYLSDVRKAAASSRPKDQEDGLGKFAAVVSATRNEIAHAKSGYAPTGDECPSDQREMFARAVGVAASQAIAWFGTTHESMREVSN